MIIISFVALIIVLDTFKSPLDDKFPGLELLLYNLFETIKDIFLFNKNLFLIMIQYISKPFKWFF